MIIFKDLLEDNQEFFCDQSFKYTVIDDFLIKVEAKMINKPTDDISSINIGANASAEEEAETLDDGAGGGGKVVDMCFYHKLEESDILSGKILKKFVNHYMNSIIKKLEDDDDTKAKALEFKEAAKAKGNKLLTKIFKEAGDNLSAYVGENFCFPDETKDDAGKTVWDVKHGCVLAVWNDDGMSLSMYLFKHGVIEEKV